MKKIAILGSTGSIGVNTLDVVSKLKDTFSIIGLSADSNIKLLAEQARRFRPKIVSVGNESLAGRIRTSLPARTKVVYGIDGLREIVSRGDVEGIVFAISGSSCLLPLVEAIKNKKRIALANKESLVSAGPIIMEEAKKNKVDIIPIDSEHSAIFQCLDGKRHHLSKIYLTGSGGPLLNVNKYKFDNLSRDFVLRHPKWKMGEKISVDSATMMNKGLEMIEAKYFFDIDEDAIEVLIHPEAVIHSMVELVDGTIFAQLGVTDMRIPIQYALTYPDRTKRVAKKIDFSKIRSLSFFKPDFKKFPCLGLARQASRAGALEPAILCAADEEVVKSYLNGKIRFSDIPKIIAKVLRRHKNIIKKKNPTIDDTLKAEEWAREETRSICYR